MSTTTTATHVLKGGEFLIKESQPEEIFTREELNEEQRMIQDMVNGFIEKEVYPVLERLELQEEGLTVSLLHKAAELGLLGMAIPEEYGGFGKDFNTNTVMMETMSHAGSFSVSLGAHTGIGTLPILYFGTQEQKKKYLPKLVTGELKASYCLTEPGSGSDALAAKSRADLAPDGKHYTLNGQKMWITNAGFADIFIVFCKIDGDKFSSLIVERSMPGFTVGAEEKKLGLKGSTTRQIFFENVKVPVENVLGEIGQGHKIAFSILNIGRFKLGAGTLGGAKKVFGMAVRYANERRQFGVPIGTFGAIKHKLGEMAARIYALDSMVYRTSNMIDGKEKQLMADGKDYATALQGAAEEYAIESSILKVYGSETTGYVVDEALQIHGGIGYSEEYPIARAYRDVRVNRIYEGTNEINRMLIVDMLMKKAMKGQLDLMTPGMAIQKELTQVPQAGNGETGPFAAEHKALKNLKKAALLVIGSAVKTLMMQLKDEQEILLNIADMLIELYACESMLLRTEKLIATKGEAATVAQQAMVRLYFSDAAERMSLHGKHALAAFAAGDELKIMLMGLKRFTTFEPVNTKELRRKVADKVLAENGWCF
ncbi:MAG TPA: acyl-CoA dehydrogenase family protein [Chitinophagales bacterium]|nr:acyl-CoA dehydrogenase family protein [Chitinophagales bacterium]